MKIRIYLCVSIVLIITAALFTGCGSSTTAPPADTTTTGSAVIMENHAFSPTEITIKKGESVTWTNKDSAKHDVTGDTFQSELLAKGESFTQTFNEAGTFEYSCTPHPYMKGKVIVTE